MSGLGDSRGREVDDYAWRAEQLRRGGDLAGAQLQFAKAAMIEQEIAEGACTGPIRVKSVLAVSAVALWYKAGKWNNAERLAHRWLAEETFSDDARDELVDLLQRCWVESQLDPQTLETTLPIELRLVGGEIKRGLAPARLVRIKQRVLVETIERIAEWKLAHEYRESGSSKLSADLEILQAPARAASYGVRLYLRSTIQTNGEDLSTQALLRSFFEFASDVDGLEHVADHRYRQRFTNNLRKLCADGNHVADIIYSSPTWRVQMPEVHLDREVRERLAKKTAKSSLAQLTGRFVVGRLNTIRMTEVERFIEIGTSSGGQVRIHLAKETSSDAIAQLLDKPVRASTHQDGRDIILDDIELSTV